MSPKSLVPMSSALSCAVVGGRAVVAILAHFQSSKESLLEYFEHALDVECAVNHTSSADTVWLPYNFPMSASVLTLRDVQDHPSMRP